MKKILLLLVLAPLGAFAAQSGHRLDSSPHHPTDLVSLQSGARTFANYCLGCHGVQFMRYSGLKELGLTEAQIRDNLMFTADKAGHVAVETRWTQLTPGTQSTVQYDATVADLVNFLVYIGEPMAQSRKRIGVVVLLVLGVVFVFAYALKKEYWKDVK